MQDELRPLKIIKIMETDYNRKHTGGSPKKKFSDIDNSDFFIAQIDDVKKYYNEAFSKWPTVPAVLKLKLRKKAIAKSHRPSNLFKNETCPIIGDVDFGELLVSASLNGLDQLSEIFKAEKTSDIRANLSALESITPFTQDDIFPFSHFVDQYNEQKALRIRIFNHQDKDITLRINKQFQEYLKKLNIKKYNKLTDYGKIDIYKIFINNKEDILKIAQFTGVQSIYKFPEYSIVRKSSIKVGRIVDIIFPLPLPDIDYPIVGLIDTGVNPENKHLAPWVIKSDTHLIKGDTDYEHGSFVAGLIANSKSLNHEFDQFPDTHAKIVDICSISPTNGIEENDLMDIIRDAIEKYSEVRIWNLSLSASNPVDISSFSPLANFLDNLQDKYNVMFIIAAGNYQKPPLRGWPTTLDDEDDRIAAPGDSIRALTVGSIAHHENPKTAVKKYEPSPFSRRGPGPAYTPKPEIVHFGGNCDINGNYAQTGILSINAKGEHAEDIGTSFSTPIVSSIAANLIHYANEKMSKELIKALMIHSAVLNSPIKKSGDKESEDIKYYGFGMAVNPSKILNCDFYTSTMIFQGSIKSKYEFVRNPFPFPDCLRKGDKLTGEIIITLVYSPPVDPNYTAEYCRTNIGVSFGTINNKTKKFKGQIPLYPENIKFLFESDQIEHGYKWSPVKVYKRIIPNGIEGEAFRLRLDLLDRAEFISTKPQDFVLILTIRDPEKKAPVYNDMIKEMNKIGWISHDLTIKTSNRLRIK